MTVVTFALPDESRDFVARLGPSRRPLPGRDGSALTGTIGVLGTAEVAAVHVGVGESPARREALDRFLRETTTRPVRLLIVSGFAGALRPGLAVGDLVLGENHSDLSLLDSVRGALAGEPLHVGHLRTEPVAVETAAAKAVLFTATGAMAVDMETAWVAAAAARAGVSATLSLRVISDAADQDFPVPGGVMFDPVRQRPRYVALPAYLATHPGRVGPFVRFVRGLGPARARLAVALERTIVALTDGGFPRP